MDCIHTRVKGVCDFFYFCSNAAPRPPEVGLDCRTCLGVSSSQGSRREGDVRADDGVLHEAWCAATKPLPALNPAISAKIGEQTSLKPTLLYLLYGVRSGVRFSRLP